MVHPNKSKFWIEVSIPVEPVTEESLSNVLFELGSVGSYQQGENLVAYFPSDEWDDFKEKRLIKFLKNLQGLGFNVKLDQLQVSKIPQQDWNSEWKKTYQPITIDDKIIIKPTWYPHIPAQGKEIIEIDPGMAFGTGIHSTTQLMIRMLLKLKCCPDRILDFGTGTGILSIVGARLFNAKILAIDIDPDAVLTAQKNAANNNVSNQIDILCAAELAVRENVFDLILVNIDRTIIAENLTDLCGALKNHGNILFSGILIEEREKFINVLNQYPLAISCELRQKEWLGVMAEKIP